MEQIKIGGTTSGRNWGNYAPQCHCGPSPHRPNGGSALAADGSAAAAILATQFAAAAASLTWMVVEWLRAGKPTSTGLVTGAVAGLATITPASGYVGPGGALIIGVAAGTACFHVTGFVKQRLQIDDSLDTSSPYTASAAWSVHSSSRCWPQRH
ncbi:MAG: hypothetical protein ACREEA_01470 [Stellaceae bacterium]